MQPICRDSPASIQLDYLDEATQRMSDLIIDYYKNPGTSSMDTSNNHMPDSNITSELDKAVDSDKVLLASNQLNMASTATSKSIFEAVI